jgi:hypothetical protein
MSSRTKTATILRGIGLVAKGLKQREKHKIGEEGWD